jgi:predicted RNA-binding Zn ribbon-like protein
MVETEIATSIFEFSGNHLCLDFANTLNDRANTPRELLNEYSDLVMWSQQAGILAEDHAQQLVEEAKQKPKEAAEVLQRAITLREAIYRIFEKITENASPSQIDLDILNTALSKVMDQAYIVKTGDGFAWNWTGKRERLDRMLLAIAQAAADLLTSEQLSGVRICASEVCNWLFLDTSKNHSRRWCDMKSCGNRAKARRHYGRKKQSIA